MSDPITAGDIILREDILPTLFADPPAERPIIGLIAGQPGSGRARAAAVLATTYGAVVLGGDELRTFHPRFQSRRIWSAKLEQEAATASAGWLRECLRYARANRHSVMLEGAFADVAVVRGTAAQFAATGYRTRVVVVGTRWADSLLAELSYDLRTVQANRQRRYAPRSAHDQGFEGTRAVVAGLEADPGVDRLTIVDGRGEVVFDAEHGDAPAFAGASAALAFAQSARMSRLGSTQWLSELHHVTAFARSRHDLPRDVIESLVMLHEIALSEVIPQLHVPAGARFTEMTARTVSARLAALRESLLVSVDPGAAGPSVVPAGPDRGGVSR
jgi:UDP-N-acetylglucosamine kinase